VITQMRQTFQAELSIRQFFTQPTIAELATEVSIAPSVQSVDIIPQRDRLSLELDQMPESDLDRLLQQMLEEADS
jgi:hypothetical protein